MKVLKPRYFIVVLISCLSRVFGFNPINDVFGEPAYRIFQVALLTPFVVFFFLATIKTYQLEKSKLYKFFNLKLGEITLFNVIIVSAIRIVYFVDPFGYEGIYPFEAQLALRSIPQCILLTAYLYMALFWRQLILGVTKLIDQKKLLQIIIIAVLALFAIVIPLWSFFLWFEVNIIFGIYIIVLTIASIYYSWKLRQHLTAVSVTISKQKQQVISRIYYQVLRTTIIAILMIIVIVLQNIFIKSITSYWQIFISSIGVHILEACATFNLYYTVYQFSSPKMAHNSSQTYSDVDVTKKPTNYTPKNEEISTETTESL